MNSDRRLLRTESTLPYLGVEIWHQQTTSTARRNVMSCSCGWLLLHRWSRRHKRRSTGVHKWHMTSCATPSTHRHSIRMHATSTSTTRSSWNIYQDFSISSDFSNTKYVHNKNNKAVKFTYLKTHPLFPQAIWPVK